MYKEGMHNTTKILHIDIPVIIACCCKFGWDRLGYNTIVSLLISH